MSYWSWRRISNSSEILASGCLICCNFSSKSFLNFKAFLIILWFLSFIGNKHCYISSSILSFLAKIWDWFFLYLRKSGIFSICTGSYPSSFSPFWRKMDSGLDWHFVFIWRVKQVPAPTLLCTVRDPDNCSVIFLQIDSPKPVPRRFRVEFSSSLLKFMKRFLIPSSEIPPPESMMLIWKLTSTSWIIWEDDDSIELNYF